MFKKKSEEKVIDVEDSDLDGLEDEGEDYIEEGKEDKVKKKEVVEDTKKVAVITSCNVLPDGSFQTTLISNFLIGTLGKPYPLFNLDIQ